MKNTLKNNHGITLISLIITIIVLLILATVTIKIIVDKGIIIRAQDVKEEYEIGKEKEIIFLSISETKMDNIGKITKEGLEKSLDNNTDANNKAKVYEEYHGFIVQFEKSKRVYKINEKKDIELIDSDIFREDTTPSELATEIRKDEDGNDITVYKIESIEDLVQLSKEVNAGNSYKGKTVVLTRNLNFKSYFSYNDYKTNNFGDLNGDNKETDLITELTTGTGFTPIGSIGKAFSGNFDGQGYKISGLYVYAPTSDNLGLFGAVGSGTIKNLGVINGSVTGNKQIGGIVGYAYATTITRCFNELTVEAKYRVAGGIVGHLERENIVSECYNKGTIVTPDNGAGIVASRMWEATVSNCYNVGEISSGKSMGGIISTGRSTESIVVRNCYNLAKITSTYCGGSIFGMNYSADLRDCFGLEGTFRSVSSYNNAAYGAKVTNCGMKSEEEMKSTEFLNTLNTLTQTVIDEETGEEEIIETPQDVWVADTTGINQGYPIFKWQLEQENHF